MNCLNMSKMGIKTFILFTISQISISQGFTSPFPLVSNSISLSRAAPIAFPCRQNECLVIHERKDESDFVPSPSEGIWMPQLRRIMASIASLGVIETGYLTVTKLQGGATPFCGVDGDCNDILNGPYSYIPFTEIPLSAMGLLAYLSVLGLSLSPLLVSNETSINDNQNRVLLTAITTAMGTFSVFLMTLLFGILQKECPFCEFSAACSIILAMLAWIGGCLPENSKSGAQTSATAFLTSTVTAILLFVSGDSTADAMVNGILSSSSSTTTTTLLADAGDTQKLMAPPPISTDSSTRAMTLANDLKSLDARMYGAYWCSHCYDQKETLGKQAFSKLEYIECSKDGVNSQNKLCKSKEVPGYPTWEINGKLYPGEQALEELEELVSNIKAGKEGN